MVSLLRNPEGAAPGTSAGGCAAPIAGIANFQTVSMVFKMLFSLKFYVCHAAHLSSLPAFWRGSS